MARPSYAAVDNVAHRWGGPASGAFAITPSDTTVFERNTRGIYVGGTGNVAVKTVEGDTVTFSAVPVGTTLAIMATQVLATGTTATLMVAMV